jgi:hypothetical protein
MESQPEGGVKSWDNWDFDRYGLAGPNPLFKHKIKIKEKRCIQKFMTKLQSK